MIKIVVDNKIPFIQGVLDEVANVKYLPGKLITREDIMDADALLIRTRTRCDETLLKGTSVKFIASATIGFDHIDTTYCESNGIVWTNASGCNSGSVKQYIASALAEIIGIEKKSFEDITLGIVGVGNVGTKVARMAKALGIKTLLNDPPRERIEGKGNFTDLETLVAQSDIITLHVPLSHQGIDKTVHLANADFFGKMQPGAWFINSSRGEVMRSESLASALRSGQIRGAAIDVWENEPQIDQNLLKLVHLATPHIAGYSADGKANGTAMSVQSISRFFNLEVDRWQPKSVPQPVQSELVIDCKSKSKEDIFREITLFAYNISNDSDRLKASLETFEQQRENYPIRREPEHLTIVAKNISEHAKAMIRELGYRLKNQ